MNEYKVLAKTLTFLAEALLTTAKSLEQEATPTVALDAPEVTKPEKNVKAEVPEVAFSVSELQAMTYNKVKSVAKKSGIDTSGTKEDLIARITGTEVSEPEEVEDSEEVSEESNEPVEEKSLQEMVEEMTADMSVEDLAELLTSVGVKATGKRQALLSKIVKAVEDGLIEMSDDEDAEEADEEDSEDVEVSVEVDEDSDETVSYFPEDISDAREAAYKEIQREVKDALKKKEITMADIDDLCSSFYTDEEGYEKTLPKDERIQMFVEAQGRLIDDEGEQHEMEDPYEMNGNPSCCGHYLIKNADDMLECEICGAEYEEE